MSRIKAILLDFDGTIMNTNQLIFNSWRHVFRTLENREIELSEVAPTFGEPLEETMRRMFPDRDAAEMVDLYRYYQKYVWKENVHMFPGMKDMLLRLKTMGYKLCLVTSRIWSTTTQGNMYVFDVADVFDDKVTPDDTKAHKPDPEPCLVALNKMDVSADEALFVGDSKYDIQCAHNAGVKAVLVGWSVCMPEETRVGINKPDYVIERPEDIFTILQEE